MAGEIQVLVVGAENTGKTLLLKRLQSAMQEGIEERVFETFPSTVATIGTNLASVVFNKKKIMLRELGGAMAPIWKNYYADGHALIFMMDVSNRFQLSASTILLYDLLSSESVNNLPILLLLNKTDFLPSLSVNEIKFVMRIGDLMKQKKNLKIFECSLKNGDGIQQLVDWLVAL